MGILKIEFMPNGHYEVKNENISQGIVIIPTTDGEYVLVNFTVDSNFAEIYDDLRKHIRKVLGKRKQAYHALQVRKLLR